MPAEGAVLSRELRPSGTKLPFPVRSGAASQPGQDRAGQGRAAKTNRTRHVSEEARQDPSPWHCRAGQGDTSGCCGHPMLRLCQRGLPDHSPGKVTDLGWWLSEEPSHSLYKGPCFWERCARGLGYKVKSPAVQKLLSLPVL